MYVHIGPQTLSAEFHMTKHTNGIGGCRCHDKMRVTESRGGAVIHHDAVFT